MFLSLHNFRRFVRFGFRLLFGMLDGVASRGWEPSVVFALVIALEYCVHSLCGAGGGCSMAGGGRAYRIRGFRGLE